ncbi:MAG: hypothetical protein PHC46_03590 [Clostridia bacterium]|nr:hypothetical protein [Clostridia bacterium]
MTNLQYNNPKDELDLIEGAVRGLENRAEELKNIQILIEKLSQMGVEFKEEGKNINKAGVEFIETTKQCKDLLGAEFNSLKDSYEEDSKSLNNYIIK